MVYKIIPLLFVLVSGTAGAECYYRSSTINDLKARIQHQSEPVRKLVRIGNITQCTMTWPLIINNKWEIAEGTAQGDLIPDHQICAMAQDAGRARLMQRIGGSEVSVSQEFVCTDQDIPKLKIVKLKDWVRESEVSPDPDHPHNLPHRDDGQVCRRFLQTIPHGIGLLQQRGVICLVQRGTYSGQWYVRELWEHFRG